MSDSTVKIAIDAMGGDNAPFSVVAGAVMASRVIPPDVELVLVGRGDLIRAELKSLAAINRPLEIVEAPDIIDMADDPIEAVRRKKNSSINIGLALQKEKIADAFVSAGNTGAVMAASLFTLGRL